MAVPRLVHGLASPRSSFLLAPRFTTVFNGCSCMHDIQTHSFSSQIRESPIRTRLATARSSSSSAPRPSKSAGKASDDPITNNSNSKKEPPSSPPQRWQADVVQEWHARKRRFAEQLHLANDSLFNRYLPYISDIFNSLTGYHTVQERKDRVAELDQHLMQSRTDVARLKLAYEDVIQERKTCSRELNSLLQRKNAWTEADVTRFTTLYRDDINLDQKEAQVKLELKGASDLFDHHHTQYLTEIRERYIEEGLYSDKIRRASTWWTWGLIVTHFLLFVSVQVFLEPAKRKQLLADVKSAISDSLNSVASLSVPDVSLTASLPSQAVDLEAMESSGVDDKPLIPLEFGLAETWNEVNSKLDQILYLTQQPPSAFSTHSTSTIPSPKKLWYSDWNGLVFAQGLLLGCVITSLTLFWR